MTFRVRLMDSISQTGLSQLPKEIYQVGKDIENPHALLVRSAELHELKFGEDLQGIFRAGAGTNNIPVSKCAEQGILVFNTPGANANAVKELVLGSLILSSRNLVDGIGWTGTLKGKGSEVIKTVEKEKKKFVGPEIRGKKLGVIGLGAIGVMVANDAEALGMEVFGFDPYLSIDNALMLSRHIKRVDNLQCLLPMMDYITLHVPLNDQTRKMMNAQAFSQMKPGARLFNFSRAELVECQALQNAIKDKTLASYVTDFPEDELLGIPNVYCVPHLGASTPESEENCARNAVAALREFLEFGNVKNSLMVPDCQLPGGEGKRLTVCNRNVPNMLGQITSALAKHGLNITGMLNKSRGEFAYNLLSVENSVPAAACAELRTIQGVVRVRAI